MMRERSNASYHHATFQAPNLKDQKSFTFPLNYTGEPAPLIKEAREKQNPEDASDHEDNANKKKAPRMSNANTRGSSQHEDRIDRIDHAYNNKNALKTSDAHVHRSSRKGNGGTSNKLAEKAKKKTEKEGGGSEWKKKGFRFGDALSRVKSKNDERLRKKL